MKCGSSLLVYRPLNLDPQLRRNVSFAYYEAGHMMYIEKNSLKKLKDDAASFIQAAVRR